MHVFYAGLPPERQPPLAEAQPAPPERYEPLPPIAELPGYLWRRMPRAARIALIALPVVVIALILILGPGIRDSNEERSKADAARAAHDREQRIARLRKEQTPR